MRVAELHYEVPAALIARYPTAEREDARLLVVGERGLGHHGVRELAAHLPAGALVVVNDTRVIPARLLGRKVASGGKVELLLVERLGGGGSPDAGTERGAERWRALGRATGRLRVGLELAVGPDLRGRVLERGAEDGLLTVELWSRSGENVARLLDRVGRPPLPPYLGRAEEALDRERYQTVYARVPGAVAAPTAGLHLSASLLERLAACGIRRAAVTLHVGPGTFRPVAVDDLDHHPMHAERFVVSAETAAAVAEARREGRPVVAIGTTVVRALEAAADPRRLGHVRPTRAETRLLIQPGYRFRVVDGLLTNFHLPGSTLLALVYAFGGRDRVRAAYDEAIRQRYRLYSYGDAMYLPRLA